MGVIARLEKECRGHIAECSVRGVSKVSGLGISKRRGWWCLGQHGGLRKEGGLAWDAKANDARSSPGGM